MFAVIYRFILQPHQEQAYRECWRIIATYFKTYRGAIGSSLHKGENGIWVAYSRWPDRATRDASWPGEEVPNEVLPLHIRETIQKMQAIKEENEALEQFDEIILEVMDDLL